MTRYATPYGAYEIDSLPSQVQVAICHGFFVAPEHRGQGRAFEQKSEQNMALEQLGYDFAIATVVASNEKQKRTMERAGWKRLATFFSRRQDCDIELWGCQP